MYSDARVKYNFLKKGKLIVYVFESNVKILP